MFESHIDNKLFQEILNVTIRIRDEHPELYNVLSETPLLFSSQEKGISRDDFKNYLETLRVQLATFENENQNNDMLK